MQKINKISLACLCSLFLALCSCSSGSDCQQTAVVTLGVDFYRTNFNLVTEEFDILTYKDTLTIFGLGNDSLLYEYTKEDKVKRRSRK